MSSVKEKQLRHWNAVAEGWDTWFEWTVRNFASLTDWFDRSGVWRPGTRVLDVACGSGYPALVGATRVGSTGRVVATDVSPAMLAVARRRAAARALANVEFVERDADDLQFDGESFDAVTNTYGLMFCDDIARALLEARRVLKPGGRLAVATWDDRSKSPFFTVIGGVAADVLSLPQPASGEPGPFRLASSAALAQTLDDAGFSDVVVDSRAMTFELASPGEYCRIFSDLAWKSRIEALSGAEAARFTSAVGEAARPFIEDGRLRLVATSVCAVGSRR